MIDFMVYYTFMKPADDTQPQQAIDNFEETLSGGNMNAPVKKGGCVYRTVNGATPTIHRLLRHVRSKGVTWVPEPLGIEGDREILSFVPGDVPHDMPSWIWSEQTLRDVARHIRKWHDATADFDTEGAVWNFTTDGQSDVICHSDFAPYNCVFLDERFSGLIDFDLCSPGSRLWDLAYTIYRFVPVMPPEPLGTEHEHSPFPVEDVLRRIDLFLSVYADGNPALGYSRAEFLEKCSQRVLICSEWTAQFAEETDNDPLRENAVMYRNHSQWIAGLTGS